MNSTPPGPLRSLRIPSGWCVRTNGLHEIDPASLTDDDPRWEYFEEDLLVIAHAHEQATLDLGWYPAMQAAGQYRAELIVGEDWKNPVTTRSTRNLDEIVAWIEEQLAQAHRLNPPLRKWRPKW
ncbi:hypothetical protein WMF28_24790 [Sorangium sp. So ce590]|uniref:hypothetical protein n=1 Tax=Sorangium sp. So ce590 TaxID=3133317 RepID=UPI003F612586